MKLILILRIYYTTKRFWSFTSIKYFALHFCLCYGLKYEELKEIPK